VESVADRVENEGGEAVRHRQPVALHRGADADVAIHGIIVVLLCALGLSFMITRRLDVGSWPANVGLTAAMLGAGLIPLLRLRLLPPIRFDAGRILVTLAAFAVGVVAASQLLTSSLLPVSTSVDAAHHLILIDAIREHGSLPTSSAGNLTIMGAYPFGAHLIAAVSSAVFRLDPTRAMNLVGFAILALIAAAIAGIGARVGQLVFPSVRRDIVYAATVVCTIGLVIAPVYWTRTIVTGDYFFGQILGLYLAMAVVLFVVESRSDPRLGWLAVIAAMALVFSYTLYLPVALLALVMVGVQCQRDYGWRRAVRIAATSIVAISVSLALFLPGRAGLGKSLLNQEGGITSPTVARLGGPLLLALCVIGGLVAAVTGVRRRQFVLLAPVVAGLGAVLCRLTLLKGKEGGHFGSVYYATKFVYAAFYCGLALSPVALVGAVAMTRRLSARLARYIEVAPRERGSLLTALSALGLLFFVGFGPRYAQGVTSVVPDDFAVARWASAHVDPAQVDVRVSYVGGYYLWVGVLDHGIGMDSLTHFGNPYAPVNVSDWTSSQFQYVLLPCARVPEIDATGQATHLVFQSGTSCLLGRS